MQIRIALIPLITSTFVFYAWGLPDNAAIRIFMFLPHLFENNAINARNKGVIAFRDNRDKKVLGPVVRKAFNLNGV
jgi:hypothetical protein